MSDSSGDLPKIARYKPYYTELEQGKKYFWCSCGLSENQPFCDGSHKGTDFLPVKVVGEVDGQEVLFCGCKRSSGAPFCDGSHNNLLDSYAEEDPLSPQNIQIPVVDSGADGRAMLDGGCFVARVDQLSHERSGTVSYAPVIAPNHGAIYQTQFHLSASPGISPVMSLAESETVLFFLRGEGRLFVGNAEFDITPMSGAFVMAGEYFRFEVSGDDSVECYASACPPQAEITFTNVMPDNFDDSRPIRVVPLNEDERVPMADRFFQILVGAETGCSVATQFIGEIPKSKAARHRHLYEESLILVTGEGMMWTESGKTPVKPGDVIFLPRKQEHSLECVVDDGMIVAGVIHPGDNPAVNY